ncbi:MAG: dihydrofolate reductase [Gemmatimonadetes bacterium]|nr:dihydrofolate reductase [Gemmatimonadota bacterium]
MTIIAAMDKNRVIGRDNQMPWHISEESKHFRRTTTGHVLLVGRKTYQSWGGKPLPDRLHVIVSRTLPDTKGVDVCRSLEEAIEKARSYDREVFICGGGEIYRALLSKADQMILSYIDGEYAGDEYFPEFDENEWTISKKEPHDQFTVVYYERKS